MNTKTDTPIHIIGLRAENVQRLELVELDFAPAGGVVEIHGRNGAGKTTLLNCLQMAFAGGRAVSDIPIRTGADRAEITVTTSNGLTITRKFTDSGNTYLDVRNSEGFAAPRAQSMLDRLIGPGRTLDPHAFMLSDDKRQTEQLRRIAGVDVRAIDAEIEETFRVRAEANAAERQERARLADLIAPPDGAELEDVPTAKTEAEVDAAVAHNAARDTLEANVTGAETAAATRRVLREQAAEAFDALADRHRADLEEMHARHARELAELEERHGEELKVAVDRRAECEQRVSEAEAAVTAAKDALESFEPIEIGTLRAELEALRAANEQRIYWRQYREQAGIVDAAHTRAQGLTEELEALRTRRTQMIADAAMPVDGLGFSEDGKVSFRGLPFSQAAHSEQLRVSLSIAMAAQPELRVINFTDASLLDADSMAIVRELARDRDYQVLAEFVDSAPGEVGIFIEAGRVTHRDGVEIEQPDALEQGLRPDDGADAPYGDGAPRGPGADDLGVNVGAGPAGDLDPDEPLA